MSSLSSEQGRGMAVSDVDEAVPVQVDGVASLLDADCGLDRRAKVEDYHEDEHEEDHGDGLIDGQNVEPGDEPGDDCNEDQNEDLNEDQNDEQADEPTDAQTEASDTQTETTDTQTKATDTQTEATDAQTESTGTQTDDPDHKNEEQPAAPAAHDDDFLQQVAQWHAYFQQEWDAHGGIVRWTTHRALPAAGALALSFWTSTPVMYALHALHTSSYLTTRSGPEWPLRFRFTDQLGETEWTGVLFLVLAIWHHYLFKMILQGYQTTRFNAAQYLNVLGLLSCVFCLPGLNGCVIGQLYGLTLAILHLHLLCMFALYDTLSWARGRLRGLLGLRDDAAFVDVDVVFHGDVDVVVHGDEDARRDLVRFLELCLMP